MINSKKLIFYFFCIANHHKYVSSLVSKGYEFRR